MLIGYDTELNKEHELLDFDLNRAINEHMQEERRARRNNEAMLQEHLKKADDLVSRDPEQGIGYLFSTAIETRRVYRRFLRRRFGYKVTPLFGSRAQSRFITAERMPSNGTENALFAARWGDWAAWEVLFSVMYADIKRAPRLDKVTYQSVRKVFSYSVRLVDIARIMLLLAESYRDGHISSALLDEGWMQYFSGWVGAQIAPSRYPDLRYALEKEGNSYSHQLLEELPAATVIELDNLVQDGVMPHKLVNRVSTQLRNAGSGTPEKKRDNRRTDSDPSDVNIYEPLIDEFLAKEDVNRLKASANLTERQRQILDLHLEGKLDREIADELGTVKGTISRTLHTIRNKLKPASGQ
jgi:hypothetical protein